MNLSRQLLPNDVRRLVDEMLHDVLSEEGLKHLESRLRGNADLQAQYRNYCQLQINLVTDTRAQRMVDDAAYTIEVAEAFPVVVANEACLPRPKSLAVSRASAIALAGMAVCLFLMVSILALAVRSSRPRVADVDEADRKALAEDLDIITVKLATNESRVLPIGEFGSVSIQGPAHFELIGNQRARLHEGRIKVRIDDERGHGFVVETPKGHVTDLGTEFGVDVSQDSTTEVLVFEGEVDLTLPSRQDRGKLHVERLIQGDGLTLQSFGQSDRIMSVFTGNFATFQRRGDSRLTTGVIADVSDNIRLAGFRKFYEIVPGGLREDALAYADRPAHDWNGVDEKGMPSYLIGADYVKPFNNDKMRHDVAISVTLAFPAKLFVFLDDRVPAPEWLQAEFRNTGDKLGMDVGRYVLNGKKFFRADRGEGSGNSIDATFSIWERVVAREGIVRLGPNSGGSELTAMYGIAAIRLDNASNLKHGSEMPK